MNTALSTQPTSVSAPQAVSVHALSKTWPGALRPVFDNLDITCPSGGITIIVGPSGCGKTTLLRCLCGLETVTSGTIRFGAREVTQVDAQKRGVAMVFQNYALYPAKTVFENIAFPLRMAGLAKADIVTRVQAAAELTRIHTLLERMPGQLSGGQRQRVGIARAIVRGPSVLLMDEPLSNLDTKLRIEMRAELATLQRQLGATTVYVTHDQTEALALADHLIVMRDGAIEQQGSPEAIFAEPATTFVADFLGSMNLLTGQVNGTQLQFGKNGVLHLGTAPPIDTLTLGFRAEDVHLGAPPAGAMRFSAKVIRSELMGVERLVHLLSGDQSLRIRLAQPVAPDDVLDLHVAAGNVHFYGVDGRRISGAAA